MRQAIAHSSRVLSAAFALTVVFVLTAALGVTAGSARASVLLDETNVVGLPSIAAPSQYSFTESTAQALTLTLTDYQTPAAFGALQVAVTLGDALVGFATLNSTTHSATLAIPSAAGTYSVFIVGTPDATQGIGSFGVCVAPATSASSCVAAYSYSGNIQAPSTASAGTSTLTTNFTSTVAGNYTVLVTDDTFPVALQSVSAGIFQGSTPIAVAIPAGTPTSVTLQASTNYQLLLAAIANTTVSAGLYSVQITDPSGSVVFARTLPVGTLAASTVVDNTTAQDLNLSLTDYAYPAPLASVGVAITQGATLLAQLTAPGSVNNFVTAAGSVEIWQYAAAGSQPGVYGVDVSTAAKTSLFSTTQVVNPASNTGSHSYAFVATLPSAGTYNLVVSDFQFPSVLQSLSATVAQSGSVLTQTSAGNFTAAAGVVVVLVEAEPPQSGNGIFGVTVQTSGASPQILLDQTQAVGGVFNSDTLTLGVSGGYTATLADLGFPADFQNLAVVVSQGSQVLGKIYGGGSFAFATTPGQYVLTFVATPNATAGTSGAIPGYGLYSIHVASTPPSVTFKSSAASVTSGGAVTLTWSSQNATSCTASGATGWTGSENTSGTSSLSVTSTETLTLSCSGDGGTATQTLTITATAASSSHGGGSVDLTLLASLLALLMLQRGRLAINSRRA